MRLPFYIAQQLQLLLYWGCDPHPHPPNYTYSTLLPVFALSVMQQVQLPEGARAWAGWAGVALKLEARQECGGVITGAARCMLAPTLVPKGTA